MQKILCAAPHPANAANAHGLNNSLIMTYSLSPVAHGSVPTASDVVHKRSRLIGVESRLLLSTQPIYISQQRKQ